MSNELERAEENLHRAEEKLHKAEAEEAEAIHEIDAAEAEIEKELHIIHFTVDGEPCETRRHELTPNEIIVEYGRQPLENRYLVQIEGGKSESYQGRGDTPIRMHDGMCFQIFSVGPMPVSDGRR
jgi:selenocysteine lyase/cysteine desulfurase